jgi:hypothetical protein
MALSTDNLLVAIEGLWRDRTNDPNQMPGGLSIAPINPMLGSGNFQILTSDKRLDVRDTAAGSVYGDYADYVSDNLGYSTVAVQTERHASKGFVIPEAVAASLEDQNAALDLAKDAMEACSNQILDFYSGEVQAAATAGLAAFGTIVDLTLATTDITNLFLDAIEGIHLASSKRPNKLLVNGTTFRRLMQSDQVFGQPAIGGDNGGTFRRLGAMTPDAVSTYFSTVLGLELIVEDRTIIDATGTPSYLYADPTGVGFTDVGVLAYADPRSGALTTFARDAGLARFRTHELTFPQVPGIAVAADAYYKVEVTDPAAGALIQFNN